MPRHDTALYELGGPSYAPLTSWQWWTIWQALSNPDDHAKNTEALDQLGGLVQEDWLDSLPPEPGEGRSPEVLAAMFAVYDQHEDTWIDRRCRLTIDGLLRLHSSGRPYQHQELDTAARMLITTAGELFRVSQDRANQTERGDRPEP